MRNTLNNITSFYFSVVTCNIHQFIRYILPRLYKNWMCVNVERHWILVKWLGYSFVLPIGNIIRCSCYFQGRGIWEPDKYWMILIVDIKWSGIHQNMSNSLLYDENWYDVVSILIKLLGIVVTVSFSHRRSMQVDINL